MKLYIYTLGCKLNQCESEALASAFRDQGFSLVAPGEEADLYIVNTCTVTSKAEQKARRMIRQYGRLHPRAVVLITGCYAQLDREELSQIGPRVRLIPQDEKDMLLGLPEFLRDNAPKGVPFEGEALLAEVDRFLSGLSGPADSDPFAFRVDTFQFHSRAYLKFQDGCNNRCAYCRTTLARGASVSLPWPEMARRLKELEDHGYREIVLTGVNITSYRWENLDFTALLEKIAGTVAKARIRLSSLEPETITPALAKVLSSPVFCPHFHIPVQSGSDTVLKRMRRKNNAARIRQAVELLREAKGDPFIAADVIVGFPGETGEEFRETYDLLQGLDFSELHIFPFSPRPGTEAETMRPMIPERISRERAGLLGSLSEKQHRRYQERQTGRKLSFLLEQPVDGEVGAWWGTSENYLKAVVSFSGGEGSKGALVEGNYKISSQGRGEAEVLSP
jgi:threonylcarbamoyladenosine tRNA methylthiotransferase MtaB